MRSLMKLAALLLGSGIVLGSQAHAQEQEAGNAASTNAEDTYKALIAKCDNTDALFLRARIRLQLGRATETAATSAQAMMDDGLALCGDGKIDEAKTKLGEALKIAEAGVTAKLGADASAAEPKPAAKTEATPTPAANESEAKPWWKFW